MQNFCRSHHQKSENFSSYFIFVLMEQNSNILMPKKRVQVPLLSWAHLSVSQKRHPMYIWCKASQTLMPPLSAYIFTILHWCEISWWYSEKPKRRYRQFQLTEEDIVSRRRTALFWVLCRWTKCWHLTSGILAHLPCAEANTWTSTIRLRSSSDFCIEQKIIAN